MTAQSQIPSLPELRKNSKQQFDSGNFKKAYDGYRKLCLEKEVEPLLVGDDLQYACQCLQQLGLFKELDELIESTVAIHAGNWRLLQSAAHQYLDANHHGVKIIHP